MKTKTVYKRDPDWNKIKVVLVTREFLTDLLLSPTDYIVRNNLPDDARIEDIIWDQQCFSFKLIIKSKEFSERKEGECPEQVHDGLVLEDVKSYYNNLKIKLKE